MEEIKDLELKNEGIDITTLPKREREDILEILRKLRRFHLGGGGGNKEVGG